MMPRGLILAGVMVLAAASAQAQQAFAPSARVQDSLRLSEVQRSLEAGPSPTEMAWMGFGLDALLNLGSYAAVLAISGGVATLRVSSLDGAATGLAVLDVGMILAQPLAQTFLVYEVGRMNPRYAPDFGWTLAEPTAAPLLAAGIVGLIYLAIPGGTALAVLGGAVFTLVPAVTTVLVQSATTEERPRDYVAQPTASIRF